MTLNTCSLYNNFGTHVLTVLCGVLKMKKRLVLKNKKRFSVFLVFVFSVIVTTVFTIFSYSCDIPKYKTIIVKTGDTLWDIAKIHASDSDIRKYIYNLKKINGLKDNTIYSGTALKVPVNHS